MSEYEFHPLADLFPLLGEAELNELADDILEHGQREPIWLYERKILDGRNRYRACLLKGINPHIMETRVADPAAFVASMNLHRRHLSEEQRGMIAARLATFQHGGDRSKSPDGDLVSQAKAAELLKVSKRRVERSHDVIEKGVPDLADAVEHGDVSVSAAAEFAKQNPPLDQARLIAEHGSPAAAVDATIKKKAARAGKKPPVPKPDMAAADRAEQTTNARLAASSPTELINLIERLERINVSGAVARMSDDERAELMAQTARANNRLNKIAVEIAISGGAKLGVLAPQSLRYEALSFMRNAIAQIEATLTGRDVQETAS